MSTPDKPENSRNKEKLTMTYNKELTPSPEGYKWITQSNNYVLVSEATGRIEHRITSFNRNEYVYVDEIGKINAFINIDAAKNYVNDIVRKCINDQAKETLP